MMVFRRLVQELSTLDTLLWSDLENVIMACIAGVAEHEL